MHFIKEFYQNYHIYIYVYINYIYMHCLIPPQIGTLTTPVKPVMMIFPTERSRVEQHAPRPTRLPSTPWSTWHMCREVVSHTIATPPWRCWDPFSRLQSSNFTMQHMWFFKGIPSIWRHIDTCKEIQCCGLDICAIFNWHVRIFWGVRPSGAAFSFKTI